MNKCTQKDVDLILLDVSIEVGMFMVLICFIRKRFTYICINLFYINFHVGQICLPGKTSVLYY